jgi:nicotinamide mononucleotide adenylyltransferase
MKTIAIMPGRYQPFHRGHKAAYDTLVDKFGDRDVFIATSDVTAPLTSPFTYSDKVEMMTTLGIPPSKIAKVKNPYKAEEITREFDDPTDVNLVFGVSEKDMQGEKPRFKFGKKKDGTPSYFQPYPENEKKIKPMGEHAYIYTVPTVGFKINKHKANSATEIRRLFNHGNESDRANIIYDLYGDEYPALVDMFNQRLNAAEQAKKVIHEAKAMLSEGRLHNGEKLLYILESIQTLENFVNYSEYEDLIEDYVSEY